MSWLRAVRDTSVAASSRSFSGQATPPSCTTACTKATGMPCIPKPTSSMRTSARGQALRPALARTEAVVHMAADSLVGESVKKLAKYYRNNVVAGLALVDAMRDRGVRWLVFSSTAAV